MSLEEVLVDLRRCDGTLPDSRLAELSELGTGELTQLARAWEKVEPERRLDAVKRLAELADGNIALNFHAVFRVCLSDRDTEVKKQAVRGLWECEEPSLIGPLVALLEEDTSDEVQAEAARALGRFALLAEHGVLPPEDTSRIARALLGVVDDSSRSAEVRQRSLEAAAPLSLPEVKTAIQDSYRSNDDQLRISSVRAMGGTCDSSWLPVLLQELGSTDADMRREAAEALGEIEEEEAVPELSELIYDDDAEIRLATVRALGNIGGPEASESLKQCLDDPNEAVSQAAEDILQGLTDSEEMSPFLI